MLQLVPLYLSILIVVNPGPSRLVLTWVRCLWQVISPRTVRGSTSCFYSVKLCFSKTFNPVHQILNHIYFYYMCFGRGLYFQVPSLCCLDCHWATTQPGLEIVISLNSKLLGQILLWLANHWIFISVKSLKQIKHTQSEGLNEIQEVLTKQLLASKKRQLL